MTRFSLGEAGARVDLQFETERMSCTLGVPTEKLPRLIQSWNGAAYNYQLPHSDSIWLPPEPETNAEPLGAPMIESFPIPRAKVAPAVAPLTRK